jgi:hypothetical protein
MSFAERVMGWNRRYDALPEDWRFQVVLWSLLALGAINMLLTVTTRFPFALLVILGIIAMAVIRVPYALGWIAAHEEVAPNHRFQIPAGGLIELNRRYEAIPEQRRFWVYPTVLLIGGAVNMMLTIAYGFPFGLLFLLTLLALIAVRAPYAAGWLTAPATPVIEPVERYEVGHQPMAAIVSDIPSEPPGAAVEVPHLPEAAAPHMPEAEAQHMPEAAVSHRAEEAAHDPVGERSADDASSKPE